MTQLSRQRQRCSSTSKPDIENSGGKHAASTVNEPPAVSNEPHAEPRPLFSGTHLDERRAFSCRKELKVKSGGLHQICQQVRVERDDVRPQCSGIGLRRNRALLWGRGCRLWSGATRSRVGNEGTRVRRGKRRQGAAQRSGSNARWRAPPPEQRSRGRPTRVATHKIAGKRFLPCAKARSRSASIDFHASSDSCKDDVIVSVAWSSTRAFKKRETNKSVSKSKHAKCKTREENEQKKR